MSHFYCRNRGGWTRSEKDDGKHCVYLRIPGHLYLHVGPTGAPDAILFAN